MSDRRPVLVIGGTRGTGLCVANKLAGQSVPVRVLARDPVRARGRLDHSIQIVSGDITKPSTLPASVAGVHTIVLTAGCRSGRPAREASVIATEYEGVRNVLSAARASGFSGRLLYMTASGVTKHSFATMALNLYKGHTLVWRLRAEDEIRNSGLDYTIIRAAFLTNGTGGHRGVFITQNPLPFIWYRIGREDLAEVFIAAAGHPRASRATFEVAWTGRYRQQVSDLLDSLKPDAELN